MTDNAQDRALMFAMLADIRADLIAPAPRLPRAAAQDLARLVRLLPQLLVTFGAREFLAGEVIDAANAAPDSPLGAVVAEIFDTEREGVSPGRRLGKFLARHAGTVCSALSVERIGEAREGVLWAVRVST